MGVSPSRTKLNKIKFSEKKVILFFIISHHCTVNLHVSIFSFLNRPFLSNSKSLPSEMAVYGNVEVICLFCFACFTATQFETCSGLSIFHHADVEVWKTSASVQKSRLKADWCEQQQRVFCLLPDATAGTGSDEAERRQPHSARRHRTSQKT